MAESKKFLIAGLGNPGKEYVDTRHNIGFMVVDQLARNLNIEFSKMQSNAMIATTQHPAGKVILAKPRTFMNLSGQAVSALFRFYHVELENLLVIHDDVDLEFEVVRVKPEGSSAGQKGMESIIQSLGTDQFPRLRVGVGRPPGRMPTPAYVLRPFTKQEQEVLPFIIQKAADAAKAFITDDIETVMNKYNQKPS
ncbi:aminoacyl-tRNA hydrolase [bacterium]|nr:aminoacyl-tRNA hydrolase [bacterium]